MSIILLTTVLTLSTLYAPQPLLPVIVAQFHVSRNAAAFLTTIVFIPLSLAPLLYGYILESLSPRRMLRVAILLLGLSEIAFFLAPTFPQLVGIRLFQGLLVPAILTALMTYISRVSEGVRVQRAMATYIAATILGGFLGRAFSGLIATAFGWRYSFLVLAASLLVDFFLLARLQDSGRLSLNRPTPRTLLRVLADRAFLKIYLVIFCLFFIFAGVMNFLPFRLTEISRKASEFRIGLMYTGYTMGIVTSLNALRIGRWVGGEIRAIRLGLAVLAAALCGLAAGRVEVLFVDMFLFCGAMFLVHATASGYLNRQAADNKGIVNGLYVSFYYAGGALGSSLPGFIYRAYGWDGFLLALLLIALAALAAAAAYHPPSEAG